MSDKELIIKYFKGDEKSLELLIVKYLKSVYTFAYRQAGSVTDAEDITQEVFVKVWGNLRKFDLRKNFKPWLFAIAKNTSVDFLRKKKSIPFSRFEDETGKNLLLERLSIVTDPIEELIDTKELSNHILEIMPQKDRALFNYRYKDGLTFAEISKLLGESINTVKSRYRRTLQEIRKII